MNRTLLLVLICLPICAHAGMTADSPKVGAVEDLYAEVSDAASILSTIDSGLVSSYQGKDRAAWAELYQSKRKQLLKELEQLPGRGLSSSDAQAVAAIKAQLAQFPDGSGGLFSPDAKCGNAEKKDLDYKKLSAALVACFVENDKKMTFEGKNLTRQSALDFLHELEDPDRRKGVFLALAPLWQSLNGKNEADSPYRRLIALAAADAKKSGSAIEHAARDVGGNGKDVERWLEQILETYRQSTPDQPVEPWSFSFQGAEADRVLSSLTPYESLKPINFKFFQDLGVDLEKMGTLYDLEPRPGKASLAYTDYVTHGRMVDGKWKPTVARVFGPYSHGGLFVLNELVHENGHVVNITAIRNRPAFVYWPSDLFVEAFADVPGWSTYEPSWQRKYLGKETAAPVSLRALYAVVILDVAWSLFELRMLREPSSDPNQVWTNITSKYLHIVPHPEISWWALRVQLVDAPGYMVNYGLGAVLTAEMREHIREALGPFDTGDARWYGWLQENLLKYGSEKETPALMKDFLGHKVSPRPLLEQIRRLKAAN